MGGLIEATCFNKDCGATFTYHSATPATCPVCGHTNKVRPVTPFKQMNLLESDGHALTLNFNDPTYYRLLAMQYAMNAETKEDVVVQAFAVFEWFLDLAKEGGSTVIVVNDDREVLVMNPMAELFNTRKE
jgi:hypothetical protein